MGWTRHSAAPLVAPVCPFAKSASVNSCSAVTCSRLSSPLASSSSCTHQQNARQAGRPNRAKGILTHGLYHEAPKSTDAAGNVATFAACIFEPGDIVEVRTFAAGNSPRHQWIEAESLSGALKHSPARTRPALMSMSAQTRAARRAAPRRPTLRVAELYSSTSTAASMLMRQAGA